MDYSIVKYTYAEIGKLRAWLIFKILNLKKKNPKDKIKIHLDCQIKQRGT